MVVKNSMVLVKRNEWSLQISCHVEKVKCKKEIMAIENNGERSVKTTHPSHQLLHVVFILSFLGTLNAE